MLGQRRSRLTADVVQMLYKGFVFAGKHTVYCIPILSSMVESKQEYFNRS